MSDLGFVEMLKDDQGAALDVQYGGNHYKDCPIQPTVYIDLNKIPFSLGCTIKYCTRAGKKGGLAELITDMMKARHFIALYMQINHGIDIVAEEQKLKEGRDGS